MKYEVLRHLQPQVGRALAALPPVNLRVERLDGDEPMPPGTVIRLILRRRAEQWYARTQATPNAGDAADLDDLAAIWSTGLNDLLPTAAARTSQYLVRLNPDSSKP